MGRIGRIVKNRIEKFIYNTIETRLKLNFENKLYAPAGCHYVPLKDDRMLLVEIDGTNKFAVAGTLNEIQSGLDGISEGDIWLFSRNPSTGKFETYIKLNHDGTLIVDTPNDVTINNKANVNVHIIGSTTITCDADVTINNNTKTDIHVVGETNFICDDNVKVQAPYVNVDGDCEFTGGTVTKAGSTPATGDGGFCAIKFCHFDGAPHVGTTIS